MSINIAQCKKPRMSQLDHNVTMCNNAFTLNSSNGISFDIMYDWNILLRWKNSQSKSTLLYVQSDSFILNCNTYVVVVNLNKTFTHWNIDHGTISYCISKSMLQLPTTAFIFSVLSKFNAQCLQSQLFYCLM